MKAKLSGERRKSLNEDNFPEEKTGKGALKNYSDNAWHKIQNYFHFPCL